MRKTVLAGLLLLLSSTPTWSAQHIVPPGADIQRYVDGASPYDEVLLQGNYYAQSVVIAKPLTLRPKSGTTTLKHHGPVVEIRSSSVTVRNLTLEGYGAGNGIRVVNADGVLLQQNSISRFADGVYAQNSTVTLLANHIYSNSYGIWLYRSATLVRQNNLHGNGQAGIFLQECGSGTVVAANHVHHNQRGVVLLHCDDVDVNGDNRLEANATGMILSQSSRNRVTGNVVRGNSTVGISVEASHSNQIQANQITDHRHVEYSGVLVFAGSTGNQVFGNTIERNIHGISLEAGGNRVHDNTMAENTYGIRVWAPDNQILRNTITDGSEAGIWLRTSAAHGNTVGDNTLLRNDTGIFLDENSHDNVVGGNVVEANSDFGINLLHSANNQIAGNQVRSNRTYGINLHLAVNNTVAHNTITGNAHCGILVNVGSNGSVVFDNYLWNNGSNGCDPSGIGQWYVTKQSGPNIIGGPFVGGNAWSDYPGLDLDGDGLGDTLLPHTAGGQVLAGDFHPLVAVGGSPPHPPSAPSPANGAVYGSSTVLLSWSGGDPDPGDQVTYDVGFGETPQDPPLVVSGQSETTFDPGPLDNDTTYYWQVISHDSTDNTVEGPIWSFTVEVAEYVVSGHIAAGEGFGIAGVRLEGLPGNPLTNGLGYYKATVTEGWSGAVTPLLDGVVFSPGQRTYSPVSAAQEGQDFLASAEQFFYVDASATGNNDGSSWEDAYSTISQAIDRASAWSHPWLFVAQGTYAENVVISSDLFLVGGFASGGGDRDPTRYPTVIDGQDSSHAVVIGTGEWTTVDGFVIQGGNARGRYPHDRGGGIHCYGDRNSVVIRNCVIRFNRARYGGGIFLGRSNPWIVDCVIADNLAVRQGGGIYYRAEYSYAAIINSVIASNRAGDSAGGIFAGDYSNIIHCNVVGNEAPRAGGLYTHPVYRPTISNSIIWGNGEQPISGRPLISFSCVEGGPDGEGNIDDDPLLQADMVHLSKGSPCVDAATAQPAVRVETDIDLEPRPYGTAPDMGADEFRSTLVLLLHMDEDGDLVLDDSGHDHHGVADGAIWAPGKGLGGSGAREFFWVEADRITIDYAPTQDVTTGLTLAAWIHPTAWDNIYAGYNRIISKQPAYLIRGANGHLHFQILTHNHGYRGVYGPFMTLDQWHYVVGTFDGQWLRLYLDGAEVARHVLPEPDQVVTNANPISLGEWGLLNEGFTGLMDDVSVRSATTTAAQIAADYAAGQKRRSGIFNDE